MDALSSQSAARMMVCSFDEFPNGHYHKETQVSANGQQRCVETVVKSGDRQKETRSPFNIESCSLEASQAAYWSVTILLRAVPPYFAI